MTARTTARHDGRGKTPFNRRILMLSTASCFLTFFLVVKSNNPSAPPQLISDPHLVEACQDTPCFLRNLFPDAIPASLALTAFGYVKAFMRRQPDIPTPYIMRQNLKRSAFSECSVVGGAPTQDQSYGRIIDSSPTIRLNVRYPPFLRAEGVSTPLGSRTDILLIQNGALSKFEKYTNGWGQGNTTLAHLRFLAGETLFTEKPLLLYRTECYTNVGNCIRALAALNTSTAPGRLPIWLLHYDIEDLATAALQRFGPHRNKIPSTGIIAILIALRICKRINVFGMSGSTKADGNFHNYTVWSGHDLNSERRFIHWLFTCSPFRNQWCGRVNVFP